MKSRFGLLGKPLSEHIGEVALQASREAQEIFGILGDGLPIDARLVIKSLCVGYGDKVRKIAIAFQCLGD
jgi:hypothetical protein